MAKEIINWLDSDADWDDIVNEIKSRCNLNNAGYIAVKIVKDFGYKRCLEAHTPNLMTFYQVMWNLYDELDELCQGEDCKNGVQLMQDDDGTYFFQITGSNFYDKEGNYAGTDTVKVWFKEFVWNKI